MLAIVMTMGVRTLSMWFRDQFLDAVNMINASVFDNGQQNKAHLGDAMTLKHQGNKLVYIDPPYYSPLSDNEYVRPISFCRRFPRLAR